MNREYRIAFMMALSAMFTLAGYEFIRSSSTVLFKTAYGADNLPLVMAALPVVVFLGVAGYGWILSRLGPRRTLLVTTLGSSASMLVCYFILQTGVPWITPILYLLKELYIVLLIEQYWSYINSSVTPATGKKVNGPVTGIAGIGGAVGGLMLSLVASSLGTETMVLIAALALLPAALISDITYRVNGEPVQPPRKIETDSMGWSLFKGNSTLKSLLGIVLLAQVIAAVLDFKFQSLLSIEFAGRTDDETSFQGLFYGVLNTSVLILQFVVAPLLMSFVALRWIHFLMPTIHVFAIAWAILDPNVVSVGIALFLFKAFDYSIFRAAKEVLYIPLGFDERYRAKEIIDVFGYRTGKGATSVLIVLFQKAGIAVNNYYLLAGFVGAALWLTLVPALTRNAREIDSEDAV